MRPSWDEYFMVMAKAASTRSTCNSRPTGAVLVRDKRILVTGYNGAVPGAPHCTDQISPDGAPFCFRRSCGAPEKDKYNYCRSAHAEANAIAQAARTGVSVLGATAYVTLAPCYVCFKLLAVAGIKGIFYELGYKSEDEFRDQHWAMAFEQSNVEHCTQLKLSHDVVTQVVGAMKGITSRRMLG